LNNVAGAIALCFVLLAPLAAYGVYLLLRGLKGGGRIGKGLGAGALLIMALVLGALFTGGRLATGVVIQKRDAVQFARVELVPTVIHVLRVTVRLDAAAGAGDELTLALDPGHFDRLHEGQAIPLRLTALGPLKFARLADAPGWMQFPTLELRGLLRLAATAASLTALVLALAAIMLSWRWRLVAAASLVLALGLDAWALRPGWMARPEHGQATVLAMETVRQNRVKAWNYRSTRDNILFTLPVPYDEVKMQVTPAAGADPVMVVDRIDAGSMGQLSVGQNVPVVFARSDPRDAQLEGGRRTFFAKAYQARLRWVLLQTGVGPLILIGLGVGIWAWTRRKRSAPDAGAKAHGRPEGA
jgi:hypothetical protein